VPAIGVFALIGVGLTSGLWVVAYLTLHPRTQSTGQTPADPYGMAYREISFKTSDGLILRGWYIPGQNGATVVLVHGYARDRTELLPEARMLVNLGYGVLLFDTRAQGASDGAHIGLGYLETLDVRAAVDFALAQSPQTQIGVIGYSIGAVAALQAAAEDTRIRAVIAVSPFASLRDTVRHRFRKIQPPASILVWWGERMTGLDVDDLRPVDVVARIAPRPILIMQGEEDQMVPACSGQRLFAAALEPKELWSVPGVAHVDFRQAIPDEYQRKVIGFFEQVLIPLD
jgi:fermentation-respiration switch protein FrsA (DUF1100 family)